MSEGRIIRGTVGRGSTAPGRWGLALAAACVLAAPLASAQPTTVAMSDRQRADRLLTVDCLLPGQVRQLGTRMTYLTPGRAVKTSAADCEIRGGEYVAYDRANYATALKVWMPAADTGDKEAQTNVGEIYERGADFANAAKWYRKAADQGYPRALINLGFLYEQGRGVPADPVAALKLYRQAAGISGTVNLEGPPAPAVSQEELNALRKELERTRQELDKARQELDAERIKSSKEIERITQQKLAASAAGNADETRRLEALLKEREGELEKRRQQVARFEQANEDYKAKLSKMESESAGMRKELEDARYQLGQSQREIDERKKAAAQQEREVAAAKAELDRQKQAGTAADAARTKALEVELAKRSDELKRQTTELSRLERELGSSKDKLAKLEAKPAGMFPGIDIAPPSIQILDPSIVVTRDTALVKVRSGLKSRPVVGRVIAPAGLLSLTANDAAQTVDSDGLFNISVPLGEGKTRVTMIAIDRQSKRAMLEFFLEPEAAAAAPAAPVRQPPPGMNLGNYYALLVGNQKYQKLKSLNSPEADVVAIESLLRDRYGFNVKTLINATRLEMMTELSDLQTKLTERDNLLIYYAGHGEIDPSTQQASWLPVDADPKNDANWISSDDLTRKIGPMKAKHVLVVADSCYSGVLTRSATSQAAPQRQRRRALRVVQDGVRQKVAPPAVERRKGPRDGRRRRQAFDLRRDVHRRAERQRRHPGRPPPRRSDLHARRLADQGVQGRHRAAARVSTDPVRGQRGRRIPVPAPQAAAGEGHEPAREARAARGAREVATGGCGRAPALPSAWGRACRGSRHAKPAARASAPSRSPSSARDTNAAPPRSAPRIRAAPAWRTRPARWPRTPG